MDDVVHSQTELPNGATLDQWLDTTTGEGQGVRTDCPETCRCAQVAPGLMHRESYHLPELVGCSAEEMVTELHRMYGTG